MAITFHDWAMTPSDGGTGLSSPIAVAPPASCATGDLCLLIFTSWMTLGTPTVAISEASGQSWAALDLGGNTSIDVFQRIFWCRFNGTWGSNPSVSSDLSGAGSALGAVLMVFRPTAGANTWAVDTAYSWAQASTASAHTITGIDPVGTSVVTLAMWHAQSDRTASLGGSGWSTVSGTPATYKQNNTTNTGFTFVPAYHISTDGSATGNPTLTWSASIGSGDSIVAFAETSGASAVAAIAGRHYARMRA